MSLRSFHVPMKTPCGSFQPRILSGPVTTTYSDMDSVVSPAFDLLLRLELIQSLASIELPAITKILLIL